MTISINPVLPYQAAANTAASLRKAQTANSLFIEADVTGEINPEQEQPTLAEFKKQFYQFIESLPIHPSQAGARQSVSIHDHVFEKMLQDPGYKTEVENMIKESFNANFSPANPAFCTFRLDANGEYRGTAGGSAYMSAFETEASDAFWRKEPISDARKSSDDYFTRKSKKRTENKKKEEKEMLRLLAEKRRQYGEDLINADKISAMRPAYGKINRSATTSYSQFSEYF